MTHMHDPHTDSLTGAFTRALLNLRLQQELAQSSRYGRSFALLLMDLDFFKSINDAFGHARGDAALREAVHRCKMIVRDADEVFRYGGDEFIILLPHTNIQQAVVLAERIRQHMNATPLDGKPPLTLSVSIGVSSFPDDGTTVEAVFDAADRRHYLCKYAGRNCVIWDDSAQVSSAQPNTPDRLVEFDAPLQKLKRFLDTLPERRYAIAHIEGPHGAGHSRLLDEARKIARLQGYFVLMLTGRPMLRFRRYGALIEAQKIIPDWPEIHTRPRPLAAALGTYLVDKGLNGLLIIIDQIDLLDRGSLELVAALLNNPASHANGLILSAIDHRVALSTIDLGSHEVIPLTPLSRMGVQIWLRHALGWEAPASFIDWMLEQTGGLPARIRDSLEWLAASGLLTSLNGSWQLQPNDHEIRLPHAMLRLSPPTNIPNTLPELIGRTAELDLLKAHVRHHHLVNLVGLNGAGKSRLALQAAGESRELFRDGIYTVSLATAHSEELMFAALGDTLGINFGGATHARALAELRRRQMLLVLDDLELSPAALSLILELCQDAPSLCILAISVTRLNLPGAVTVELAGLPTYEGVDHSLDTISEAVELFYQRALLARPDFTPTDDDWIWMTRICQLVNGIPLGIELTAAWMSNYSCREIGEQIASSLAASVDVERTLPLSLHAIYDSLWTIMGAYEQDALARLAMFQESFSRVACNQVTDVSAFFIDALISKQLLTMKSDQRYTMHPLTQRYIIEQLAARPEQLARARAAHAVYYMNLLHQISSYDLHERQAVLNTDIGNIRAAWLYAATIGWHQQIDQALQPLTMLLTMRGWYYEGIQLLSRAADSLDSRHEAPAVACRARVLTKLAQFHYHVGNYSQGIALLQTTLMLFSPDRHIQETAEALHQLGGLYIAKGDYREADNALRLGLSMAENIASDSMRFWLLSRLGVALWRDGDTDGAMNHMEQALALARRMGEPAKLAVILCNMGDGLLTLRNDPSTARQVLEEGLDLARAINEEALEARILACLAKCAFALDKPEAGYAYMSTALRITLTIDAPPLVCEILANLATYWAGHEQMAHATTLANLVAQCRHAPRTVVNQATMLRQRLVLEGYAPDPAMHMAGQDELGLITEWVIGLLGSHTPESNGVQALHAHA